MKGDHMHIHALVLLGVGLFSWSFAQAAPQTNLDDALQEKVDAAVQEKAQTESMFGSVEALWQYQSNPPHHRGSFRRTQTARTHATAVISGDVVFIHLTPGFAPGGLFVQQPKLLELTFTSLDGTKVVLQPSYQPLKRHWGFARVKNNSL